MCGIVYVRRIDGKNSPKMTIKRYKFQKSRGSDGFGFIAMKGGKIVKYARAMTEKEILALLSAQTADEVIFHHRFPTSTPNFSEAAHPIKVSHHSLKYDYYVIHNGIISNDDELKTEHDKLGFVYNTTLTCKWKSQGNIVSQHEQYNDSEALAIELARNLDIGGDGIGTVRGSIAFMCLQVKKNTGSVVKLFFGRNVGSPLRLNTAETFITVTSEGAGQIIEPNILFSIDYSTNKIETRNYKVGTYLETYTYTGYAGHESWSDYEDYVPVGGRAGFSVTKRLPVVRADEDELDDENEYIELSNEYADVQRELALIIDKDSPDAQFLEDRRLDIEDELKSYEARQTVKLLQLP